MSHLRTRWAAIGAAVAVTLGAGGFGIARATISSGERAAFVPITPCRLFKTNAPAIGPRTTPLGADDTATFQVTGTNGNCTIPAGATAVVITLVGLNQTVNTFLTAFPADVTQPVAATMNLAGTATGATSSLATIKLSATGALKLFNKNGTVNVIADITGYYEDHNHDDRYFTEAETSALIAASPAPWQTIPSGTTVIGPIRWDEQSPAAGGDYRLFFPFPAVAPAEPTAASWAPDASLDTTDDDATCTGTVGNPTAPPGKVCLYYVNAGNAASITGEMSTGYLRRGFEIWFSPKAAGDIFVYGTWAYTAP